jgi:uncharacterized paraquat-inducible protein A
MLLTTIRTRTLHEYRYRTQESKPITLTSKRKNERFCECCKQIKPANNKPKVKGWKCTKCQKLGEQK